MNIGTVAARRLRLTSNVIKILSSKGMFWKFRKTALSHIKSNHSEISHFYSERADLWNIKCSHKTTFKITMKFKFIFFKYKILYEIVKIFAWALPCNFFWSMSWCSYFGNVFCFVSTQRQQLEIWSVSKK